MNKEIINIIAEKTDNYIEWEWIVYIVKLSEKFIKEFNKDEKKIIFKIID